MRFFKSALYRVFASKHYLMQMGTTAFISILGIFLLKELRQQVLILPGEVLEVFKMGENYNIGFVTLPDLGVLNKPYCDEIIGGIFSGSMAQLSIVFVVVSFLCKELQNGYFHIAVMKGQNRYRICLQYLGISILMVMPVMFVYLVGTVAALMYNKMFAVKDPAALSVTLFTQMFMMLGISICAAALVMIVGTKDTKIIAMCMILMLPLIPKYLNVLTQGRIQIEHWILVSRLIASGDMAGSGVIWNLILTFLTVIIVTGAELCVFHVKRIE